MEMYEAMCLRYGDRQWWPCHEPSSTPAGKLEICIGAILTQNTNWGNVEKALKNLRAAGLMSVSQLHAKRCDLLGRTIRPAGYYNVKAKRLKNFIRHVSDEFDGDICAFLNRPVDQLRCDLLSINGVGPETADSIILYAAKKATFVVDAYTKRIFLRHKLIEEPTDYETLRDFCKTNIPKSVKLWNDYHAQLVAVGKDYCKPTPRCDGCPLQIFLPKMP